MADAASAHTDKGGRRGIDPAARCHFPNFPFQVFAKSLIAFAMDASGTRWYSVEGAPHRHEQVSKISVRKAKTEDHFGSCWEGVCKPISPYRDCQRWQGGGESGTSPS